MKTERKKNKLRNQLQQQRASLGIMEQALYSEMICKHVVGSNCFKNAQHIAFYTPVKGEADPLGLHSLDIANKSFYLPVLSPQKSFHLIFVKINDETRYKNNIYGIPEPIYTAEDIMPAEKLDLVIMPLVAVDRAGNRMGMGGGYYDRSFAFKKEPKINSPQLLGFAYDFQLLDSLSAEAWDVPLDFITTNQELIETV